MAGRLKTLFAEEIVMLSKVWRSRPRRQHRLAQQSKYCSNLFWGNIYRHKLVGVNNLTANGFNKEDPFFARSITTLCPGIMAGSSATGSCDKEQIKIDYKCNWIFHVMPDLLLSHVIIPLFKSPSLIIDKRKLSGFLNYISKYISFRQSYGFFQLCY